MRRRDFLATAAAGLADLRRMIQAWGAVPFTFLNNLASQKYTYAFIGTEDFTMYPLLQPGTFEVRRPQAATQRMYASQSFGAL